LRPLIRGPCLPACLHDGGICAGVGLGAGPVVGRLPATLMTKMNTNEHLQQARQLHEQWQFEQARQAYEKVLEQEPAHAEALHGMAQLLGLHQLRSAEALPYLEAAIGVRPADFGYWRLYIHMLIREGLLDMAISLIDVARANGMQEIALEQLEKDVALVQGAQAAAFLEVQAARWPLGPAQPEAAPVAGDGRGRVPEAQLRLLGQLFAQREHAEVSQLAGSLVRQYPKSGLVWKLKAAADHANGRIEAALQPFCCRAMPRCSSTWAASACRQATQPRPSVRCVRRWRCGRIGPRPSRIWAMRCAPRAISRTACPAM
jgi:protein O-GlcNAc transferase